CPDIGCVGHHQDDDLGPLGERLQCIADRSAGLADIRRQPALAKDKELMPAFDQVEGHRMTHDAEPDKTDFHDPSRAHGETLSAHTAPVPAKASSRAPSRTPD